jgi:thiosulfate/3-mercaptopyruvate sulfurtransferase
MSFTTLVDPAVLCEHLDDPDWIVFDVRHDLTRLQAGIDAWLEGHIPGALFLPVDEALSGTRTGFNGRHPLPDGHVLAGILAGLGVGERTQVVACDSHGGMFAARLWWLLRWLGHEPVAVLDGGIPAWVAGGGALTREVPRPRRPVGFRRRPSLVSVVTVDEVLDGMETGEMTVVDARSPDRFAGQNETIDPVAGHIPGAINRFYRENLRPDDCFKSPDLLRWEFEALFAGRSVERSAMQCGSGITACHNLLALDVAGLSGSALYAGSWSEWCSDPTRPVAR